MHIQQERCTKSEKLRDRAKVGILVGYEGDNIYQVYVPTRLGDKIVQSSAVTFNENDCYTKEIKVKDGPTRLYKPEEADAANAINLDDIEHKGVRNEAVDNANGPTGAEDAPPSPEQDFHDIKLDPGPEIDPEPLADEQDLLNEPAVERRRHSRLKGSKNKPKDAPAPTPEPAQRAYPARGNRGPGQRFDEHVFVAQVAEEVNAFLAKLKADPLKPMTLKAALKSQEAAKWKKAMDEEVKELLRNKTWVRVKRPRANLGIKVLRGK